MSDENVPTAEVEPDGEAKPLTAEDYQHLLDIIGNVSASGTPSMRKILDLERKLFLLGNELTKESAK